MGVEAMIPLSVGPPLSEPHLNPWTKEVEIGTWVMAHGSLRSRLKSTFVKEYIRNRSAMADIRNFLKKN